MNRRTLHPALRKLINCFALSLGLLGASFGSRAATMSDLWWNPAESGWGANVIEQQGTLFITLFVYGVDGRPTWYVASSVDQVAAATGRRFTGALYVTSGPWFGAFFNPAGVGVRQVGSITFQANTPVSGTMTYSVDGVLVSKPVQRQTWKHINLGGTYYGALDALSISTCALTGADAEPFYSVQNITATVSSSGTTGNITMSITDPSGTSTFVGTYAQYGALYEVTGTLNAGGLLFSASIRDFTADDDGIRGNLFAQAPSGCVVNYRFAAVRPG